MKPTAFVLVALHASSPPRGRRDLLDELASRLAFMAGCPEALVHEIIDDRQLGIDHARGTMQIDALVEITHADWTAGTFANRLTAQRAEARELLRSASLCFVTCSKNLVVPVDATEAPRLAKRMSLITRARAIDHARFTEEWTGKHARDVPSLPGIAGYSQNIVIVRYGGDLAEAGRDHVPVDGIVELWFADAEAIVAAFASPQAAITQGHARTFLDTITTYLVETRKVAAA